MTVPVTRVVHSIPGRTRLRTEDIKGDADALSALQTALEDTAGVQNVRVNVRTGSILVEHDGSIEVVLRTAEERGYLRVDGAPPERYLAHIHRALIESDERLKTASSGRMDLETISFMGFVAGGIYQCFNGHGLPAGVTLLRYAVELATSTAIDQARAAVAKLPKAAESAQS
jgi:Heavy metal associated domain 2